MQGQHDIADEVLLDGDNIIRLGQATEELLDGDHAHHIVQVAIVNRITGVTALFEHDQGLRHRGIPVHGGNIGTRHHGIPYLLLVEVEHPPDHLGLLRVEHAVVFARRQDGADFILGNGEVPGALLGQITLTENPEQALGGLVHDPDQGLQTPIEEVHDPGHGQTQGLGLVEGQNLGRQFATDDMQEGNNNKTKYIGRRMGDIDQGLTAGETDGHGLEHGIDQVFHGGNADGTQGERHQGDANLGDRVEALRLLVEQLHGARGFVPGIGQLLNAAAACRGQGNLGTDEEGVAHHQQENGEKIENQMAFH